MEYNRYFARGDGMKFTCGGKLFSVTFLMS